jgi:hypothetical protein
MEVLTTFVLFIVFTVVFVILFILPGVSANNLDLEQLSPEEFLAVTGSMLSGHIWSLVVLGIVFVLIYMFLQSFFMAGAIGMSKEASEKGDTNLRDMSAYGMKNVVSLFLAKILMLLLALAGIIFMIPGILSIGDLGTLLSDPQQAIAGTSMLLFGLLIWGFYLLAISIVLIFVQYALVIENLDPVSAIEKGVAVFMSNKSGALSLWIILIVISLFMQLLGEIAGFIDVVAQVWSLVNPILTFIVIPTLTTIWWTRLYLNRNGKKLYSLEDYIFDH